MAKAIRDAYGEALLKYAAENENVVVLDADLAGSTKSGIFGAQFSERFFNVGIAEANMTGMAAGLAATGKIPFINSFAAFLVTNGLLSIRSAICYTELNVKIAGAYGGLSDAFDGPTHHAIEDIAIMRAIPGLKVMVASDERITDYLVKYAIDNYGPMYIRLSRNAVPDVYEEGYNFEFGKANTIKDGGDVAVIACGLMVTTALEATKILENEGISVKVVDMFTIKPIDKEAVIDAAKTGLVISLEEHNIIGGLGSAVAEVMAGENLNARLEMIGVNDEFTLTGDYESIMDHFGLSAQKVAQRIKNAVEKK